MKQHAALVIVLVIVLIVLSISSLSLGVTYLMQEPPAQVINALSPRWLAVGLSVVMLTLLAVKAQAIWESKQVREVRDYGPNLLGYAVTAIVTAFLFVLSDIAGLQALLPKSPLTDFVLLARFSAVPVLTALGLGLLVVLYLSDWMEARHFFASTQPRDIFVKYDLTDVVVQALRGKKDFIIPWENSPRIVRQEWDAEEGKFKLEIVWEDRVKKWTEKVREEKGESKKEITQEEMGVLRRCEVETDAKGRIISISMLRPEIV